MKGYTPPPRMIISNEPAPITRNITITEGISVKDLAEKLGIRAKDVIARLVVRGVFATINQTLDAELASEMARFFGAETEVITFEEQAAKDTDAATESSEEGAEAVSRPPVVTIMGHVDHGKTTLLDSIRSTNVAGGEAGGITQHIGAYKVRITDEASPAYGREIVFLDTPGHEAFTRMRARGAKATDIVVLVTAADDGVMPQTLEAIDHAHAAEVPIIVAVNKIDKPGALPERVKKQLADRGLVPEEWGGTTVFVDVSAKQKTNLNLLMEMICLTADLQELKATLGRAASGVVLEAKLDRGRGPVGTILVQNGTLTVTARLANQAFLERLFLDVLGREITATIANLREIDWSSLAMNFTFILTPDTLAGAPHSFIATVHAPAASESAVERAVTKALPSISSIRVKEAIESVKASTSSVMTVSQQTPG